MATIRTVSYALDIGVYDIGTRGQVLASTTAAWCRVPKGTPLLEQLRHSGTPDTSTFSVENTGYVFRSGRSIPGLAEAIAADLKRGWAVALGFEAPMWFPVEHEHRAQLKLFAPRFEAERGAEWYLQSGAAATLKSIALGILLREELRACLGGALPSLTTEPSLGGSLTLYEGFVVGPYKVLGGDVPDETDALLAAVAWGAVHRGFELPSSLRALALHSRGTRAGPSMSIWATVWGSSPVSGPPDCDVVAVERLFPAREDNP